MKNNNSTRPSSRATQNTVSTTLDKIVKLQVCTRRWREAIQAKNFDMASKIRTLVIVQAEQLSPYLRSAISEHRLNSFFELLNLDKLNLRDFENHCYVSEPNQISTVIEQLTQKDEPKSQEFLQDYYRYKDYTVVSYDEEALQFCLRHKNDPQISLLVDEEKVVAIDYLKSAASKLKNELIEEQVRRAEKKRFFEELAAEDRAKKSEEDDASGSGSSGAKTSSSRKPRPR